MLLLLTLVIVTNCDHYRIVPINSTHLCQNYTCFTLQELLGGRLFIGMDNLTLTLLPGYHKLDNDLFFNTFNFLQIKGHHNAVISFLEGGRIKILKTKDLEIDNVQFTQESTSQLTNVLDVFNCENVKISNSYITNFNCSNLGIFDIEGTSHFELNATIFKNNFGKSIYLQSDTVNIENSRFTNGAIDITSSNVNISNTQFNNNTGYGIPHYDTYDHNCYIAPLTLTKGTVKIFNSIFSNNSAGAICSNKAHVFVFHSQFRDNYVNHSMGQAAVIYSLSGNINISNTLLTHNSAHNGGVICSERGDVHISNSFLRENSARFNGGAIYTVFGNVNIYYSNLTNNVASMGGAIHTLSGEIDIFESYLTSNRAEDGGAIYSSGALVNITKTTIANNSAQSDGGALRFTSGSAYFLGVTLTNNTARNGGAIASLKIAELNLTNCTVSHNSAHSDGGAIDVISCNVYLSSTTLSNNRAHRGGAIYAKSSATISITHSSKNVIIVNNTAMSGGGIYLTTSAFSVNGQIVILQNKAHDGGGIYAVLLSQIKLMEGGAANITTNSADRHGGGIYSTTSHIEITSANLTLEKNIALAFGGGVYLQHNAQINFAECLSNDCVMAKLEMSHNKADYGGGIYVDDDTADSDICEATIHDSIVKNCFIRNKHERHANLSLDYINICFTANTAKESGNDLFGGLLDRCKTHQSTELSGIGYIKNVISNKSSISSRPVQVQLCNYQTTSTIVKSTRRGELFVVNVVAIDQTNTPIPATIHSSVSSGRLGNGQEKRSIQSSCTQLEYNVFSNASYVLLDIYADGPCTNMGLSKRTINVTFQPCECPLGFQKSDFPTECKCECDPKLDEYIINCNLESGTIELNTNVWIGVIEDRNNISINSSYIIHDCPFDYCAKKPFNISLNSSQEIDRQCFHNRSGVLCGECSDGLSMVLATSVCKECTNIHLLLIIPFALAGIALVSFLLIFDITIASGTVHGLIFFVNILAASKETFLPFMTPNFLTVFVSWVNLDVGIQTCFYNGLHSQSKVLLQLVFPVYIFFLVLLIIVACKYSIKFSNLLSNRNPVAVLCTLIVLSYSKLLRTIIAALQYTVVRYPDGENHIVWLYDGNVLYFTLSHIPRFISAAIILTTGGIFTVVLFFGQWFPLCSEWRTMKWLMNTTYHGFIDAYHAPLTPRHRYWMGLLLLALIVQNLIAAMAVDKFTPILSAGCIAHALIFLKIIFNPVCKKWFTDYLETCFLLILVFLSYGTLYIGNASEKQRVLATVSMAVAFVLLIVIIYYHVCKLVLKSPKMWFNIAILAYGISYIRTGQENILPTSKLEIVSTILALMVLIGAVVYHFYTYLRTNSKPGKMKIGKAITKLFEIEQKIKNKDKEPPKQERIELISTASYNNESLALSDSNRYITPPIIRLATKLDQLREPYLDILAPITEDDYNQAPPPPPANIPPKPTFTIITI